MPFTAFSDWKRQLLARREIQRPDGRSLYQYRLTEEEFSELQALLRKWLGLLIANFGLGEITRVTGFPALFVLYASEWWRRRFDGSHWSWEPILRDIGADPDTWNQTQRSECVRLGLQDWERQPRAHGGLRFLGSVAVEGGLPLKLLAEARGGIGLLLSQVLEQAASSHAAYPDIFQWVASLEGRLPRSYRQPAIYALLADVADTVLRLRDEANLAAGTDAIARLDQQVPDWRTRFPLPIEDAHARGLIEQLVKEATRIRVAPAFAGLTLERKLVAGEPGVWSLQSALALPDAISAAHVERLFSLNADELPRAAELALSAGNDRLTTGLRRLAGRDSYRVDRCAWGYGNAIGTLEHLLHLSATDGRAWSANTPRGEALDDELPWLFGPEDTGFRFLKQGGGSVAAMEAVVALPCGWTFQADDGAVVCDMGLIPSLARRVLSIRGVVRTQGRDGSAFRLRTGQAGASDDSLEWRGQRLWLDFRNPGMAFKGFPKLHRVRQDGGTHPVDGTVGWSPIGANAHGPAAAFGPFIARYPATGEIKRRTRLAVLPADAGLRMEFVDARSGIIHLDHWKAIAARVLDDRIEHSAQVNGDSLTISLRVDAGARTPEKVELEVFWPHTTVSVGLALPFPARGVRAYAAAGREIQSGTLIAAQDLAGVRLALLPGQAHARMTLEIASHQGGSQRVHGVRLAPGALSASIRLQDYMTDIQHLLSIDDSPDARVRVTLRIGGADRFHLDIARYAAKPSKGDTTIGVDLAVHANLPVEATANAQAMTLRLERPGDEPWVLPRCEGEGGPSVCWDFAPGSREPGNWLVYPAPESSLAFRPTLWPPIRGTLEFDSPLARALGIQNPEEREKAIDASIESMSLDFLEPCWDEVERLAGQIGHLPLATLDLWRRFARSPNGMAAMAFRFASMPAGFLERFAQELPFAWETVPYSAWTRALGSAKAQCEESFGSGPGELVFRTHMADQIAYFGANHGALNFLLGVASGPYSQEAERDTRLVRLLGMSGATSLFDGASSPFMRLLQIHADDEWPQGLGAVLVSARRQPEIAPFLHAGGPQFRDGVTNLPLLLAAQVVMGRSDHWFADPGSIHALRAHRAFDPDWFDAAFNQTFAWCLASGLLG